MHVADEECRREAPSIIIHDTSEAAQRPSTNKQRREAAFVSEFLSRGDRDRRARTPNPMMKYEL